MVYFIAEIGSNHNRDWTRCQKLIETASEIGCQAVKFQLFCAEKTYEPARMDKMREMKKNELLLEWLPAIRKNCDELGLKFICSPFDLEAVEILEPFIDAYKIASYELPWDDLLKAVLCKNKPIILSTGLATLSEIHKARHLLITAKDLTILHCSAKYPSVPVDCHLSRIRELSEKYSVVVGWSDHTVNHPVVMASVALGARTIELHLDLEDMSGNESKYGHCWKPENVRKLIKDCKDVYDSIWGFNLNESLNDLRAQRRNPETGLRS